MSNPIDAAPMMRTEATLQLSHFVLELLNISGVSRFKKCHAGFQVRTSSEVRDDDPDCEGKDGESEVEGRESFVTPSTVV